MKTERRPLSTPILQGAESAGPPGGQPQNYPPKINDEVLDCQRGRCYCRIRLQALDLGTDHVGAGALTRPAMRSIAQDLTLLQLHGIALTDLNGQKAQTLCWQSLQS